MAVPRRGPAQACRTKQRGPDKGPRLCKLVGAYIEHPGFNETAQVGGRFVSVTWMSLAA